MGARCTRDHSLATTVLYAGAYVHAKDILRTYVQSGFEYIIVIDMAGTHCTKHRVLRLFVCIEGEGWSITVMYSKRRT